MNKKLFHKEKKNLLQKNFKILKKLRKTNIKKKKNKKLFLLNFENRNNNISYDEKKKFKKIIISKTYNKWVKQAIKKAKIRKLRFFFQNYINFRYKSDYLHYQYIKYDLHGYNNSNFFEARINKKRINDIKNVLFGNIDISEIINNIKSFGFTDGTLYKIQNNQKIGKQFVDKTKRNSLKKIIKKKPLCRPYSITYKKIKNILDGALKNTLNFYFEEYLYLNHFDILYYPEGGFFKPHRDDIQTGFLKEMCDLGYKIYTGIICLENAKDYNDGSTLVWSKYDYNNNHYTMKKHIFNTGSKKGNALFFNSNLLHGVTNTKSPILKLKFEICVKHSLFGDRIYSYNCKCETCNSKSIFNNQIKIWKTFYCKKPDKYLPIPNDLIFKISTYLGYLKKCNCFHKNESIKQLKCQYDSNKFLYNNCNCGCDMCQKNNNCECEEYILNKEMDAYDDYEQDYDTHCNGDDY